jgi:hypothetical protein
MGPIRCPETSVKYYGAVEDGTDTLSRNVGKGLRGPLKMGPIRCPETSVKDYHSTLRNTPEERRSLINIAAEA